MPESLEGQLQGRTNSKLCKTPKREPQTPPTLGKSPGELGNRQGLHNRECIHQGQAGKYFNLMIKRERERESLNQKVEPRVKISNFMTDIFWV